MATMTIADMCRGWWKMVGSADASPTQVAEMRRAFYSGAYAMLTAQLECLADPDVPDEVGAAMLAEWDGELKRFFRGLIAEMN